jgi:hypothetical protein
VKFLDPVKLVQDIAKKGGTIDSIIYDIFEDNIGTLMSNLDGALREHGYALLAVKTEEYEKYPNDLDIIRRMSDENDKTLKAFPISNVEAMYTEGKLGKARIAIDFASVSKMMNEELVGMFILADKENFNKTKEEMAKEKEDNCNE